MSEQEKKQSEKKESRSFYCKVAIVGQSGTGKSYLSKTADPLTTGYINVERKPLPYRQQTTYKFLGQPKNWAGFKKNLEDYGNNPEVKTIIIDSQTMAFNVLIREMGNNFTGFDVYKNYNRQVYEYLELMKNIQKDIIVISHDELVKLNEGDKVQRMATHGKEFEGKIEQHYSVVLYTGTRIKDNKPQYFLRTFEEDTSTKVPEGMFSADGYGETPLEIPNDAKFIFDSVEKYYTI